MKQSSQHRYYTYMLTNPSRTVLYTGVSNDILNRLQQHKDDAEGNRLSFAGKYNCTHVIYYEERQWINDAVAREKEIKGWTRSKKLELISSVNPEMKFLEDDFV